MTYAGKKGKLIQCVCVAFHQILLSSVGNSTTSHGIKATTIYRYPESLWAKIKWRRVVFRVCDRYVSVYSVLFIHFSSFPPAKLDRGQLNFSPDLREIVKDTCALLNKFTVNCTLTFPLATWLMDYFQLGLWRHRHKTSQWYNLFVR